MLLEHEERRPRVDPSAYVAPTAVLSGDVRVGARCRILFGAVLTDEGGPVEVGASTIVMEHAVLRGTHRDPLRIGAYVLVGPHASLSGATIEDECFLATGVTVFNGAHLRAGCEVRINGVVHLRTVLEPGTVVPIGWVAVGDPALIALSDRHDEIWRVQKPLDFPGCVFGLPRQGGGDAENQMPELARRFGRLLGGTRETVSWMGRRADGPALQPGHRGPATTAARPRVSSGSYATAPPDPGSRRGSPFRIATARHVVAVQPRRSQAQRSSRSISW